MKRKFKTLGKAKAKYTGLETFPAPKGVTRVLCKSDEVTAVCPITGQPDWYTVEIDYQPKKLCVESKSLKLYLQSFRQQGHFCEDFSRIIAEGLMNALDPQNLEVTVIQKPRGGITIESSVCLFSET